MNVKAILEVIFRYQNYRIQWAKTHLLTLRLRIFEAVQRLVLPLSHKMGLRLCTFAHAPISVLPRYSKRARYFLYFGTKFV